jgi:hypothetical protein
MTYTGEVRHGVVVLKDAPPLEEGTVVRVEVEEQTNGKKLRPGSPEAVLQAIRGLSGSWLDSA